jgi:hypothetical protein
VPRPGSKSAIVFLAELIHTTGGIHDLLLAGIEGMARGTNLDMYFILTQSGTGHDLIAATAYEFNFLVMRMDVRFHD